MNRQELLKRGILALQEGRNCSEELLPELKSDALLLMEKACHISRNEIFLHGDAEVDAEHQKDFDGYIARRRAGEQTQYICGYTNFMGLDFRINQAVLIPRFDTEILVEEVLRLGLSHMSILDMCTGSGCILLSLLKFSHDCTGTGADISAEALKVAKTNAVNLGIDAEFVETDMFEGMTGKGPFDIIVSNPPYISSDEVDRIQGNQSFREPRQALDGGRDGLGFYRILAEQAGDFLTREGRIFMEIGYDQGESVRELFANAGYREVEVHKDLNGCDRVISAYNRIR